MVPILLNLRLPNPDQLQHQLEEEAGQIIKMYGSPKIDFKQFLLQLFGCLQDRKDKL